MGFMRNQPGSRSWLMRTGNLSGRAGLGVLILAGLTILQADQEAGNVAHVVASSYGRCYARSVPSAPYGDSGKTTVFQVTQEGDIELESYPWFSQRIYLECNVSDNKTPTGLSIIRMGSWARGHLASKDQLAIGFYFNGYTLREHSTLDIAGSPENVSQSVSHYTVIEKVEGYQRLDGNQYSFSVVTTDGRSLRFDAATGKILDEER